MGSGSKNRSLLLDQLANFMAKEVEEMSDEELLEETGGAGGLAHVGAQRLRRLLKERAVKARQGRLAIARAGYSAAMANRGRKPRARLPIGTVRERIKTLFTGGGDLP